MKMKVEDYLNKVSYKEDPNYSPSVFSIQFVEFIKQVNGERGEENKTPVLHYRMLDQIALGEERIANLIFRGAAKAISLETQVYVYTGSNVIKKKAKHVKEGDYLIDRDGRPTKVLAVSEIFYKPCYRIYLRREGKDSFVVSEDHLNIWFREGVEEVSTLKDNPKVNLIKKPLYIPLCKPWITGKHDCVNYYKLGMKSLFSEDFTKWAYGARKAFLMGIFFKHGMIGENGTYLLAFHSDYDFDYLAMLINSLGGYVYKELLNNKVVSYLAFHLDFIPILRPFSEDKTKVGYYNKRKQNQYCNTHARVWKIEPCKQEPTVCFKVDSPTESFTLANGVITHNTTVFGEYMVLYLAAVGGRFPCYKSPIKMAMYVSDSIDNGVKSMRKNLQYRYENSPFLQSVIPEVNWTDIEWRFKNARKEDFVVNAFGAKSGIRGTRALNVRPQLAILDDLVSDEDARSPTSLQSIKETIHKAISYALHPTKSTVLWLGTPFNANDPLYEAVESGAWAVNVFPVCEKFPCTKEEFRGAWEDRFPYEYVLKRYTQAKMEGKINDFNQELMLRIMSDDARLLTEEDIKWYNRDSLLKFKQNFNFYITTDFATSEKTTADLSVISVWAYNNNGDWFYVDGIATKQDMGKNIDELFRFVSEYSPMSVGIEVTGQQGGFIPWIQQEMINRNIFFNLASSSNTSAGIRPTTDKMQRFNVVLPWFKMGKMYFPLYHDFHSGVKEMLEELRLASHIGFKSKHDDAIDTVSMLALLPTFKPNVEAKPSSRGIFELPKVTLDDNRYFV